MKTKTTICAIAVLCCLTSCRTVREVSTSTNTQYSETVGTQQEAQGSETVSVATRQVVQELTQRAELDSTFYTKYSAPDSTGKQYITETGGSKKNTGTVIKSISNFEQITDSKLNYLITKTEDLERKLYETTSEMTVKTGFTFLEKTGLMAIGLLVLIVVFTAFKLYLKFKK